MQITDAVTESRADWPLVDAKDDGIRPAGPPDECFYCRRKVGEPHGAECVIVTKRVRVRYIFEIDIDVPHFWDEHTLLFHRNDSTWCADNAIAQIEDSAPEPGCLCNAFTCEYVGISDDTPRREIRDDDSVSPPAPPHP